MLTSTCKYKTLALILLVFLFQECREVLSQTRNKKAILKYLEGLPARKSGKLVSGQFESWGNAVKPLNDSGNYVNQVFRKTGKWVGLVGAEYHNGTQVNYPKVNQLFEEQWKQGGFCQLYLIMSNPGDPASFNGGGKCNIRLVLDSNHRYHQYFFNELDKVAEGLRDLQQKGVVVFLNMFAEATADWFWWGGGDPADFISLYRASYDYLVHRKGLDNLLFIYEPCSFDTHAMQYYPGDNYVDMIGFSFFVDYNKEIDASYIRQYKELKETGKPLAISQWGPRRGKDQTGTSDQPPADNLKLIRGIQKYFPEIVWWMNWNYAYAISTETGGNLNGAELLQHPWVLNREDISIP